MKNNQFTKMAEAEPTTDYEEVLQSTVDEIWSKYDTDNNGRLDKSEMRAFVEATMTQAGVNKTITDEDFKKIFEQVDKDESGTIEKDEMAILVKRLAGY